jgi:enoyl-CoA hydratase/carnithine racemase
VAVIWLARPEKRNALTYRMWEELGRICTELAGDPTVRVVVLRGRGEHFCAGADITELHAPRQPGEPTFAEANLAAEHALAGLRVPTVAATSGSRSPAAGSGSRRPSSGSPIRCRRSSGSPGSSGRHTPNGCCSPAT